MIYLFIQSSTDSEGEKVKQKRKRKNSKNMKPALTIGLPILGYNNNTQVINNVIKPAPGYDNRIT